MLFDDSSDEESPNTQRKGSPKKKAEPIYNKKEPDFEQRVYLYLKPIDYSHLVLTLLLVVDTCLSWLFIVFQIQYIFQWQFESLADKTMQILIGFGITGLVLVATILDGLRYLPHLSDKIMFVISCLLLKPILLPVLFPGSCFTSPIPTRTHTYVHSVDEIKETKFMIAVEESNFLLTFTLAGVSAISTFIAVCQTERWGSIPLDTLVVSLLYGIFGLCLSVLVYGRKVEHHVKK